MSHELAMVRHGVIRLFVDLFSSIEIRLLIDFLCSF